MTGSVKVKNGTVITEKSFNGCIFNGISSSVIPIITNCKTETKNDTSATTTTSTTSTTVTTTLAVVQSKLHNFMFLSILFQIIF